MVMSPARIVAAFRRAAAIVALCAIWCVAIDATAAGSPAPAGTTITSTASTGFVVAAALRTASSNTVKAVVAASPGLVINEPAVTVVATDGSFTVPVTLSNTGNAPLTIVVGVGQTGPLATQGVQLVLDTNGNHIADPGEPVMASSTSLTIAPGTSVSFVLAGKIGNGALPLPVGTDTFTFTARTTDGTVTQSATTTVVSKAAARMTVTSLALAPDPMHVGDLPIGFTSTSDTTVTGSPVTVDGATASLVQLRVPLPAQSIAAAAVSPSGATPLFHRKGDPPDSYYTTSGPMTNVDGFAFGVPTLAAGQPLLATVAMHVDESVAGSVVINGTLGVVDNGVARSAAAAPLTVAFDKVPTQLGIYGTNTYAQKIPALTYFMPIYLELVAPGCYSGGLTAQTNTMRLDAKITGDYEFVQVMETGPGSGVFRTLVPITVFPDFGDAANPNPVGGRSHTDAEIAVDAHDTVTATAVGCGSSAAPASALVDPVGVVFDSRSGAVVGGAIVTLIDVAGSGNGGQPGQPAVVFGFDGVTRAPSTLTTAADGMFQFPLVAASTYKLVVQPPTGFTAPSHVAASSLPQGFNIDLSGSFGGSFVVANQLVMLDYPVDATAVAGLFVEKTASKSTAEIGDFVDYVVTVHNTSTAPIAAVVAHDRLPHGFTYQPGTTRIDGARVADPVSGPVIDFNVGTIAASGQTVIAYRLRIGPGAKGGDGMNHANATAGTAQSITAQSNTASVRVTLSDGGVFSDRAYLLGKVFADCNGNGVQDPGERGIPGIRIVLEDGTSAITDEDGKYSLYGLLPRTHVAKVDATTMIPGMKFEAISSRNAGDGTSRFVDLKNGELERADFAVAGCGPDLERAIDDRRSRTNRVGEAAAAAKLLLSPNRVTASDARTLPSSGVLDAGGVLNRTALTGDAPAFPPHAADRPKPAPVSAATSSATTTAATSAATLASPLAELLPALPNTVGFIDLVDGAVMPSTQATIRIKGPAGAKLGLFVNGQPMDAHQVGERSVLAGRDIAGQAYVGIALAPGVTHLEATTEDGFGNVRGRAAIDVKVAGPLARITIEAPAQAQADGHSTLHVGVKLLDAAGLAVTARTMVTLDATLGKWTADDLDPREPGTQVFVEGGFLDAELQAPSDAGKGVLRAQVGATQVDTAITFLPDLRPMMAVGLIEGVFNLRSLGSNAIVGAQTGDAFEREIRNVSRSWGDGKDSAAARGALYLKGKVLGSTLLTVAYDSDKPQGERLFRDIQPDQFYPVYGDSSAKGFDAQSTSRLYVRVDHGTSSVLYGDFSTQTTDPARALTQYNRTLTGAKTRIDEGPLRVDAFAADTSSRQVIDEIPGNGTSGPFTLSRANGVVNSEQVHVLTRDRNQPAVIVKDVAMTRFVDYEIEAYTGRLLFKSPIPSVDGDLNPIVIRVTYEVDDGGQTFWVGGVDAKLAVTDRGTVGGTYIRDTDPTNRATLRGVNGTLKLGEKGVLVGEFAQSDSDLYGLGKGRRFEYRQDDENVQARLYAGHTDASFVNPSALLSQGRSEYGGKVGLKLDERDRLSIEGVRTEDVVAGGRREGVLAGLEHRFDDNVKVEVGVRQADETLAPAQATSLGATPVRFTSLRTKVTVPTPGLVDSTVYGEYERAVIGNDGQIAAVGGTYALPSGGKLYARHEFISSLSGAYDLNSTQRLTTTVIGVDADYMKDGHVFNEYRVGGGIDARSAETAIGLRNLWRIADGVNVTTTAENITPVGGMTTPTTDTRSTAVTGAIDYTANPDWKGSARAEYRNAAIADSWLLTTGAAYKLADSTTLLGKAIFSDLGASATAGGRRLSRVQLGTAYRPVDSNTWNVLARVEFKREQDLTVADAPLDESATIGSLHVNLSPTPDFSVDARYAIKWATDRADGIVSRATTQLLGGRAIKDLDEHWDIGFDAFVLASDGIRSRSYALGAEAGYRVATNLWVSVGYNVSGFKDRDLSSEEYTQRGAYLRMRFKFDENVFAGKPAH